jgi:adenylate cyclase
MASPESEHETFDELLLRYTGAADADARKAAEAALWQAYGVTRAILVADMSGFSELSQRHGIVHYLAMVRRMQLAATPMVERHGGTVVKFVADNCFAIFADTASAIRCAVDFNNALDQANRTAADQPAIHVSCGIDRGEILVIGNHEFFGNAVNRACKLGEDVAARGEILVTKAAAEGLPAIAGVRMEPLRLSLSGIELEGYSVRYR